MFQQVGVKSIETGVWGAYQNVLTNVKEVKDEELRNKVTYLSKGY
jgi:glutamate formiminotransferase / formiminotetrahydrofolate cyclodeaminase